ncbi:MAG: helix-turn-helix transcriptional regulator [Rhodobacteraceae bacterium]|nr:helix-turn-helix transcriptional regulator [Paracoccaceae bacterium]
MRDVVLLILLLATQLICGTIFISETLMTLLGITHRPLNWEIREVLEIGATLGLIFGAVLGVIVLRRSIARQKRAEEQLRQVSGAFMELMHERFQGWGLTSAERDVALFAIKGMNTHEIAVLRGTAEGTVKAQTNAIYRKSGVNGRPQLLSLFIDDLMDENALPASNDPMPGAKPAPIAAVA